MLSCSSNFTQSVKNDFAIQVRTAQTQHPNVYKHYNGHSMECKSMLSGAHHQEPATTPYSCRGVFTDQSIFSLNLSRIQIPTGTSVTNCNYKHGLMLICRHVHVRPHCFILTEACSCWLEVAYFVGKISKNRLVCKNADALAYYGNCRLLIMSS